MNFFTELREGLGISWAAIRANKMRSVLTTLGIVIGILTVTLMGTAIQGLNRAFMGSVSFIGADVLYVSRFNWFNDSQEDWLKSRRRREFTLGQVQALGRQLTLASAVSPTAEMNLKVAYRKRHSDAVDIVGTTEDFLYTSGLTLSQGRFITPGEAQGARPVCVIGYSVATNLFDRESPLGKKVVIGQHNFEVVGVLDKMGSFLDGGSLDNQAVVPVGQFVSSFWNQPDYEIQVKAKSIDQLEEAKAELRSVMRKIRRLAPSEPDDFAINQQEQLLDMFHRVAGTIAAIGLFITGLSLFVGGIGIMNIMFVSVAERTREIGIRKAIGAKRRTILVQFLIEAASICLIGGLVGLSIAWPLTLLLKTIMPAVMSPMIVGIALSVSLITGVLSGFFPAWRAARMNPVDALRTGE
jgi:putative ABC transport system permease protein